MQTNYLLSVIFVIFCSAQLSAQTTQQDSASIVLLFQQAARSPSQTDSLRQEAQRITDENKSNICLRNTYLFNLGKYFFLTAKLDSAMSIADRALVFYKEDSTNHKSSPFHNLKGSILAYQAEYKKSILEFQTAIKILELHNNKHQAALIKNNVANIFFNLVDYKSAHRYSRESYQTLKAEKDTIYLASVCGIYAISTIKLNDYDEGKILVDECLNLAKKYKNPVGLILGNYGKGVLYFQQKNYKESIVSHSKSLQLSEQFGLKHYAMLNKISLLASHVELKEYAKAIALGKAALAESKAQKNKTTFYSIHKNLAEAYVGIGDHQKAYIHSKMARQLYITTASIESQKNINDILIKYESEKKEKELIEERLKITQQNAALTIQNFWIMALSLLVFALLVIYYFYNKLQKQKYIQLQKEQEKKRLLASIEGEENERKRISNELHDGVASSLTAIKIQLEHRLIQQPDNKLEPLLAQLKSLHEETRRISHNLMPISLNEASLMDSLATYCKENTSEQLKLIFTDNTQKNNTQKDIQLSPNSSLILYRTIQELIHNAQKHSQSAVCFIQTSLNEGEELTISVEDEGVGFDIDTATYSQGLKSIAQRVKDVGGEFSIESKKGQGTLAMIRLKSVAFGT